MRIPRIYYPEELKPNSLINLTLNASNHLKVLKKNKGDKVEVFNGKGTISLGCLEDLKRNKISLRLEDNIIQEKPLIPEINLGVSNIKNFDKVVKDSSQLGVSTLASLITERTKLRDTKKDKFKRWQLISASSCEQSGLNWLPEISQNNLKDWIVESKTKNRFFLDPKADLYIGNIKRFSTLDIAIGPEGGFSTKEENLFKKYNFIGVNCGNLVIKTESMPIVVLSMLKVISEAN